MIKFLFGKNGAAEYIVDMLKSDFENGIPSILIVPEQEAVSAERMTLSALPPAAQLTLEVLNFSRLYNRVCREYGGLCYSYITKPMKHIMMWKTLRELSPLLREYSENAISDPAFADTVLASISEIKRSAITTDMLEAAADECARENKSLSARLRDLALIYSTYDFYVNQSYSDSADDLSRLCDVLSEHDFFKEKNVYIYSFTSFTATEHLIIDKIFAGADNTLISIPLPYAGYSDISTASIENSLKMLLRNAGRRGDIEKVVLDVPKDGALAYLSSHLWSLGKDSENEQKPSCDGRIVMEICEDQYAEAEAASSHILELLRDGVRCRDIAVIMRDAQKYKGIIEPALKNAGIPFFVSEKTDICALAPIKFILSAIRIKQYNWRKNDVISHIKTGLCDFDLSDADMFEEYINTWNINGSRFCDNDWTMNPDGFSDRLTERGSAILKAANEVRKRLCEPLGEFFVLLDSSDSIADMCRSVYTYIERVGLREKSHMLAEKELSFGNKKSAAELVGIYDLILRTLADIGQALEDVSATTDDFYTVLKTAFEKTEIGTIPTSIDEVTVGSASMLRAQHPKYVFILGLCEGEFPANTDSIGLLTEYDRETLAELDVVIGEDQDVRTSDELMFVSKAFSAPSEKLYLFTSLSDSKGSKKTPSLPFRRVEAMFCDIMPHRFFGYELEYLSGSAASAASHLRNIRRINDAEALKSALLPYMPLVGELDKIPVSTDTCGVSPELVRELVGDRIYISPSSLEKYVKCPFGYFASYMLSLREIKYGRFQANTVGNFVHYIMENIIRFAIPENGQEPPSVEEIRSEAQKITDRYITMICPDESLHTKRMEHLYSRLRRLSLLLIDNISTELSDSDFRPAFFELHIDGKDGGPLPLVFELSNGTSLVLKGFIDRVDIWRDGDEVYVRILDYKTGSKQFSLSELDYGLNTQMLLYLFAVCTSPGANFRYAMGLERDALPLPAGVVYLSSAIPKIACDNFNATEEDILLAAEQKLMRSGIIVNDEKIINAMSHSRSKDFLMGVTQKNGKYVGKALLSSEELTGLFEKTSDTLKAIGEKIYAGIADCSPIELAGQDPCKYCTVKQMCRKNNI